MANYLVQDFSRAKKFNPPPCGWQDGRYADYKAFTLKKDALIFGRKPETGCLDLALPSRLFLKKSIAEISGHIEWLGGDFKNGLINELSRSYTTDEIDTLFDDKWYESLEIFWVLIIFSENEAIKTSINTGDNSGEAYSFDVEIRGRKIVQAGYGLDPANYDDPAFWK